jgi:hypothetical protein
MRTALPGLYLFCYSSEVMHPAYPVTHLDPYQKPKVKLKSKKRKDNELVGVIQAAREIILSLAVARI